MVNTVISEILYELRKTMNSTQLKTISLALSLVLNRYEFKAVDMPTDGLSNNEIIEKFIAAKRLEGCSSKTLSYYFSTISKLTASVEKPVVLMNTDDLRRYLTEYQEMRLCNKITMDNIRRIFSSFFTWLEDEDIILKSPIRRIKKVKIGRVVKDTFSDEDLEHMRDSTQSVRDLAIIDILSSTGMRVGELIQLNIDDIDFQNRECKVHGKGDSERIVYFDARSKIHLQNYLDKRVDQSNALFVGLSNPHERLSIGGVESMLKRIGKISNTNGVYPHKFRRTMATHAINKGMPIEQVQRLLGHVRIDTTLHYAYVEQDNVKISHRRYIS